MLIMPLEKSIDWARPPWVTFLLIISCSIVLFVFQNRDDQVFDQGMDFYFSSELPKLELPAYAKFLNRDKVDIDDLKQVLESDFKQLGYEKKNFLVFFLMQMEYDEIFSSQLKNNQIITAENDRFNHWKVQRKEFETIKKSTFNAQFSFTPADHDPVTFITHQFLHGGTGHLVGNMLFLFLIGYSVEAALGSVLYLICYLMTGLGAVTFFWLANPESNIPLVGASGAISGVMGMYAGIFGKRKIRMFYWVLFYFNYIKAPAFIMLLFWVAYEIFQLVTMSGNNVAYMAHIGGFVTGGVIALILNIAFKQKIDTEYLDASMTAENKTQRYQQASNLIGELKIPAAIRILKELHTEYPDDYEIRSQLFKVLSYQPDNPEFHQLITEILSLTSNDTRSLKLMNDAFQYYLKVKPGQIKLSTQVLFKLIIRFAKAGFIKDAEYIAQIFLSKKPNTPDLDNAILAVANSWQLQNQQQRYDHCIGLIRKHFPGKVV